MGGVGKGCHLIAGLWGVLFENAKAVDNINYYQTLKLSKLEKKYIPEIPTKQSLKLLASEIDYSLLDVGWN